MMTFELAMNIWSWAVVLALAAFGGFMTFVMLGAMWEFADEQLTEWVQAAKKKRHRRQMDRWAEKHGRRIMGD